jgi:hypothetical protein
LGENSKKIHTKDVVLDLINYFLKVLSMMFLNLQDYDFSQQIHQLHIHFFLKKYFIKLQKSKKVEKKL